MYKNGIDLARLTFTRNSRFLEIISRYQRNEKYVSSLSKWVRKQVVHYRDNRDMVDSLTNFIQVTLTTDTKKVVYINHV